MTIDLDQVSHPTTVQALAYAQDYYLNYYDPLNPLTSYHRYHHSDHIEVLATWGYHGDFFVQSRIKLTVLYGLPSDWTDEVAMRGWIFWRNPITGLWTTILESEATSVHHWQDAHQHIKQEATDMALKRAKITAYYPVTHQADIEIYPHPGETMQDVPLAPEIGPVLAALLPDCALAIFYDTAPPSPYITSLLDGVPPAWITSNLLNIDDHVDFGQYQIQWALFHMGTTFPTTPAPVQGQPFWRTDLDALYVYDGDDWLPVGAAAAGVIAATNSAQAPTTHNTQTYADLITVQLTPTNLGDVEAHATVRLRYTTGNWRHFNLRLRLDTTYGLTFSEKIDAGQSTTKHSVLHLHWLFTAVPAGAHTIALQWNNGNTGGTMEATARVIAAIGLAG